VLAVEIPGYTIIGPVAYQGKAGCDSPRCTRMFYPDGSASEDCIGWHCVYCDEPCSSQGHKCDAGEALLAEARKIIEEGGG
jgi:hypothetical protein